MKLCITGGGTGGHLMIAEALVEAAVKRGHELIFIGSASGQDKKYFQTHSSFSHVYFLKTTGVVNQKGLKKLLALYKIFIAFLKARYLLKKHKIQAVYSVGGFSAAPASFASLSKFIPLFIHEQNAVVGRLNAILKPFSKSFISAYDDTLSITNIKGYPVKEIFYKKARVRHKLKTIIFLGGSHGAKAINDLALRIVLDLNNLNIKIIHQAGENDFYRVKKEYERLGVDVELYSFTNNLANLIIESDLAVSRAGASTLWELTTNGCPALYIPYPYAASDHQYHNAEFIIKNEMGWRQREDENLKSVLIEILKQTNLEQKSEKLLKYSNKDVADKMIKEVEDNIIK